MATTKLKPRVKKSAAVREAEKPEPQKPRVHCQPPPAAEGFRLTLKATRIPRAPSLAALGGLRLSHSPASVTPGRKRPGPGGPSGATCRELPLSCPAPWPVRSKEISCPRPANPSPAPLPVTVPELRQGAHGGRLRGEKLAPSPGLPLCAEACPRTRSAAIRDDSRDEIPPWRGVWSWNLRHTPPRSLPRSVPRAPRPPRPGGLLPVSKAGDPGFGTLSSPPRAPSRHPSPAAQREVGTISQITFRAPPPQFLSPPERAETAPPRLQGSPYRSG